jgi:hypothetical protein
MILRTDSQFISAMNTHAGKTLGSQSSFFGMTPGNPPPTPH